MYPLASSDAQARLALDAGDRIRFLRAARGAYVDGSASGWEDGHYLWGPVDVIGDPAPLFRLEAREGRLWVGDAQPVPELVPWEAPKDGAYVTFDGGDVTGLGWAETEAKSILYISLLIGAPVVLSAKGAAIALTHIDPVSNDLEGAALRDAA